MSLRSTAQLFSARERIAERVRELRRARGWSQAELARKLALSQSRLSELERGSGSFTAEQLLLMLRIFNVTTSEFVSAPPSVAADLQNALARLGARHLHERDDRLPSERLRQAHDVIVESLLEGSPRLVTATAPVLVQHADRLSLSEMHARVMHLGAGRRVPWLVDNTQTAITWLASHGRDLAHWTHVLRRLGTGFAMFLDHASADTRHVPQVVDVLGASIRSAKTVQRLQAEASEPSRLWGILTPIQVSDFADALESAHAVD